jgi:NADH dehydrogenase
MGRVAARNVLHRIAQTPTSPFLYQDLGNLATIGHNAAVVDLSTPAGALRFSGRWAWWFWLLAHIYFLIGFRNRLVVMLDWGAAYLSFSRNARVVAGTLQNHTHSGEI